MLWSDRRVPTTGASRLNFVATAEAGVRIEMSSRTALTLGYRFHHLSNAGLARDNYALASHLFTIGVRRNRSSVVHSLRSGEATKPASKSPARAADDTERL